MNILHPGANYGWPMLTYGIETEMPGMEQPVIYWTPSIAPSGMAFYIGARTDATERRILRLEPP